MSTMSANTLTVYYNDTNSLNFKEDVDMTPAKESPSPNKQFMQQAQQEDIVMVAAKKPQPTPY